MNVLKKVIAAVIAGAALVTGTAQAALDGGQVTALATEIQTDGQAVFDAIFPVVATLLALTIGIKLFKRFGNKV